MADEKEQAKPKAKPAAKAAPKGEPKAEPKAEHEAKAKPEHKPEAVHEPARKVEAKAEAKPKAEEKPKAEAKPKAEVKPKAEAKPKAEEKPLAEAKPKAEKKEAPKEEAKPKAEGKGAKGEELEIVEGEIEKEEGEGKKEAKKVPKVRPVLTAATRRAMEVRADKKKREPTFHRQEWFRYRRLEKTGYRRPRGMHSKMRKHWGYRPPLARIGYRGPKISRGLHPSGFEEVLVWNERGLDAVDPKRQAVRIGHGVGGRKRQKIQEKADELGIRILNRW